MNINDPNPIIIDGVTFCVYRNVNTFKIDAWKSLRTYSYYDSTLDDVSVQKYIIFEPEYHDAFAHWVFEGAILLPSIVKLLNRDPDIKLVQHRTPSRTYKGLFYDMFNIPKERIEYVDNFTLPQNNICWVTQNMCLNTNNEELVVPFTLLLTHFHNEIMNMRTWDHTKSITNLLLPRNKVENFASNDRAVDYSNAMNRIGDQSFVSYDTMSTTRFFDQIQILLSAQNIYLDYGSNMFVNGFFASNSNIWIINYFPHHIHLCLCRTLYNFISQTNTLEYI